MANVFLYVPNVIGYTRILLLVLSYCVLASSRTLFCLLYLLSFVLDAADGWAARSLGQSSRFGEYLDMLTDRMGTLMLLFIGFGLQNAPCRSLLLIYAVLDIVSHWLQQVVAALNGAHHKNTKSPFYLLNLYYSDKKLMAALCVGAEAFFLAYVCANSQKNPGISKGISLLSSPLMCGKLLMNALQLVSNSISLGKLK